jgi:hypothetical protein
MEAGRQSDFITEVTDGKSPSGAAARVRAEIREDPIRTFLRGGRLSSLSSSRRRLSNRLAAQHDPIVPPSTSSSPTDQH